VPKLTARVLGIETAVLHVAKCAGRRESRGRRAFNPTPSSVHVPGAGFWVPPRDPIEEGYPVEDHAPNPATRKAPFSEVDATTEKLQHKFGGGHGPLSDQEIAAVVRDETEELQDAPVQAFTPLIAENNARNRLQELADEADRGH
jgi:hypothetical protein